MNKIIALEMNDSPKNEYMIIIDYKSLKLETRPREHQNSRPFSVVVCYKKRSSLIDKNDPTLTKYPYAE